MALRTTLLLLILCCTACSSSKKTSSPATVSGMQEYHLSYTTAPERYGYHKDVPIKVGGALNGVGVKLERQYLNSLRGPQGQEIHYSRGGSCCSFPTPNALIGGLGLLDVYRVTWEGAEDTVSLYLNMYDADTVYIPRGFSGH